MKSDKELKKILEIDPLYIAEELIGKSYKENEDVTFAGLIIAQMKSKIVNKELFSRGDTTFSMKTEEYKAVIETQLNFKQILVIPFIDESINEELYVYWNGEDSLLLVFDTYRGNRNGGNLYFNLEMNEFSFPEHCSGSFIKDTNIFCGYIDCREALGFNIEQMKSKGKFLKKWKEQPFLWLLHYVDTKVKNYNYKEINEQRIKMLPKEIQNIISGE